MLTRAVAAREAASLLAELKSDEAHTSEENSRKRKAAASRPSRKWRGKASLGDGIGEDADEKAVGVNVTIFNTNRETNRTDPLEAIKEEFPVSATNKDYPEIFLPTPSVCPRKRKRVA